MNAEFPMPLAESLPYRPPDLHITIVRFKIEGFFCWFDTGDIEAKGTIRFENKEKDYKWQISYKGGEIQKWSYSTRLFKDERDRALNYFIEWEVVTYYRLSLRKQFLFWADYSNHP